TTSSRCPRSSPANNGVRSSAERPTVTSSMSSSRRRYRPVGERSRSPDEVPPGCPHPRSGTPLRDWVAPADEAGNRRRPVGGTMRRAGIVLATVVALTAVGAVVTPADAAMPATPGRIDGLRGATRAIVAYSRGWGDTRVAVRLYQRKGPGDRWGLGRGAGAGRAGYNGFSANRHEGDGTPPAGTFGFVYGFGSQPNPGMHGFSHR